MIYRTPDYCLDFHCIAGDCRDSCCKGWEIDIDPKTAAFYNSIGGEFGERLRKNISDGCFVLTDDERCPFLNKHGLCDIYIKLGEENLCRICSDHPRYFEWFGSVKEGGAGLCCEAAAALILSRPFVLCEREVPDEEASCDYDEELFSLLLNAREDILAVLNNENIPLCDALSTMLDIADDTQQCIDMPVSEQLPCSDTRSALQAVFNCLSELEPIDDKWQPYINKCAASLDCAAESCPEHEKYLRRIALYIVFRYLMKSVYDGEVLGYAKFAAVSVIVISWLFRCKNAESDGCSFNNCADIAKNYSKETEYCEENMAELLERFSTEPFFSLDTLKSLLADSLGGYVDEI